MWRKRSARWRPIPASSIVINGFKFLHDANCFLEWLTPQIAGKLESETVLREITMNIS